MSLREHTLDWEALPGSAETDGLLVWGGTGCLGILLADAAAAGGGRATMPMERKTPFAAVGAGGVLPVAGQLTAEDRAARERGSEDAGTGGRTCVRVCLDKVSVTMDVMCWSVDVLSWRGSRGVAVTNVTVAWSGRMPEERGAKAGRTRRRR